MKKQRLTIDEQRVKAIDAYERAQGCSKNDARVIIECERRGFSDAQPRRDVLTFGAWPALGRHVAKGERGMKITVWISRDKANPKPGESKSVCFPKTTTVFHISQTERYESDHAVFGASFAGALLAVGGSGAS